MDIAHIWEVARAFRMILLPPLKTLTQFSQRKRDVMQSLERGKVPPTGGGKSSIAPVIPIGYRPAWDQYKDERGRSQQVTEGGYFYYDSAGFPRAFKLRELYLKATILDLYGANIAAIVELWPGARKGTSFRPWEVGRWLMAAAVDAGFIEPLKLGFSLNGRGRWVPGPLLARADRTPQ